MPQSHPLTQAFFRSPHGLCGKRDPLAALTEIQPLETRLRLLAFASLLSAPSAQALILQRESWIFQPEQVAYKTSRQVKQALQTAGIRAPKHIARVWWQISRGIQGRFKGSFRALLQTNQDDALAAQAYLRRNRATFPVLSAPVTSARWLDSIHRLGDISLKRWEELREPLTAKQQQAAREFGLTDERIHPSLAQALRAWSSACQRRDTDSCGLEHCPRRG